MQKSDLVDTYYLLPKVRDQFFYIVSPVLLLRNTWWGFQQSTSSLLIISTTTATSPAPQGQTRSIEDVSWFHRPLTLLETKYV